MSAKKKQSAPKPAEPTTKPAEPTTKPAEPVAEPTEPESAEPVAGPTEPEPTETAATPAVPAEPVNLDEKARDLNKEIDAGEKNAAVLLWKLGDCLEEIKKQHPRWKWENRLTHAESLGINKSRFTRAIRIRRHFASENMVLGKSIYEALGYDRGDDEPVPEEPEREYEKENAPFFTTREDRAGQHFIKAVGSLKRAAVVLACIERGDKPVKKVGDKSWVPAWEEIKGNRDELRSYRDEGDIHRAFTSLYKDKDIPSYQNVKANYVKALKRFREIRAKCYELAQKRRAEQAAGFGKVVVSLKEISDMLVTDPAKPETAEAVPVTESGKDDSNGQHA